MFDLAWYMALYIHLDLVYQRNQPLLQIPISQIIQFSGTSTWRNFLPIFLLIVPYAPCSVQVYMFLSHNANRVSSLPSKV